MSGGPIPFLWLCGPSGVGKSAVGWEIFTQLNQAGVTTAYVDLDQIGLCYPAPTDDPDNHRVKARNLGVLWPTFRAAGAQCLVVSGYVDTADRVRDYADLLPETTLTLCRLRVGHDELRERIVRRGWLIHLADQAGDEADALDRGDIAGLCVDTDGVSVPEAATLVRHHAGGWPDLLDGPPRSVAAPSRASDLSTTEAVPVLWLCGPCGVGKSTIGWEIFVQLMGAGVKAAYVDLSQIGFCRPTASGDPDNHRIKALNLGAMWRTFRAAGARSLVISGAVSDRDVIGGYADALPGTVLTVCRLHAGQVQLTQRILLRGRGGGPPIPGDELAGLDVEALRQLAIKAAHDGIALDRAEIGGLRVDTDTGSARELAQLVRAQAGGWPNLC